jgi:hypothetical protein
LLEAASCDILLLVMQPGENHFGSLLECGAALGAGKTIFLVSPHTKPFLRNHPRVRSFATLAEAITAIMARVRGEEARSRAVAELQRTLLEPINAY